MLSRSTTPCCRPCPCPCPWPSPCPCPCPCPPILVLVANTSGVLGRVVRGFLRVAASADANRGFHRRALGSLFRGAVWIERSGVCRDHRQRQTASQRRSSVSFDSSSVTPCSSDACADIAPRSISRSGLVAVIRKHLRKRFTYCPGVYQIGDVQARSCCVIGTSGDILMLKRTCVVGSPARRRDLDHARVVERAHASDRSPGPSTPPPVPDRRSCWSTWPSRRPPCCRHWAACRSCRVYVAPRRPMPRRRRAPAPCHPCQANP